jgi:hypothetical protein
MFVEMGKVRPRPRRGRMFWRARDRRVRNILPLWGIQV